MIGLICEHGQPLDGLTDRDDPVQDIGSVWCVAGRWISLSRTFPDSSISGLPVAY